MAQHADCFFLRCFETRELSNLTLFDLRFVSNDPKLYKGINKAFVKILRSFVEKKTFLFF